MSELPPDFEGLLVRLVCLLENLRNKPYTAEKLAELALVDKEIVDQDLDLLLCSGFPLLYHKRTRKWELVSDYNVPGITFTPDEILAILLLFKQYGEKMDAPVFATLNCAILKMTAQLSPEFMELIGQTQHLYYLPHFASLPTPKNNSFILTPPKSIKSTFIKCKNMIKLNIFSRINHFPYKRSFNESFMGDSDEREESILSFLLSVLKRKHALKIMYQSISDNQPIITEIHPYTTFFDRTWYLIGYAKLYHEIRTFKLLRILELEELKESFIPPPNFSLAEYFGNAWSFIREPYDVEVVIRFSPKVAQNVREVQWHQTQQYRERPDGSVDVAFLVSGLNEILWWILGYGAEAEVLEPLQLRLMVRDHVDRMLALYGQTPATLHPINDALEDY